MSNKDLYLLPEEQRDKELEDLNKAIDESDLLGKEAKQDLTETIKEFVTKKTNECDEQNPEKVAALLKTFLEIKTLIDKAAGLYKEIDQIDKVKTNVHLSEEEKEKQIKKAKLENAYLLQQLAHILKQEAIEIKKETEQAKPEPTTQSRLFYGSTFLYAAKQKLKAIARRTLLASVLMFGGVEKMTQAMLVYCPEEKETLVNTFNKTTAGLELKDPETASKIILKGLEAIASLGRKGIERVIPHVENQPIPAKTSAKVDDTPITDHPMETITKSDMHIGKAMVNSLALGTGKKASNDAETSLRKLLKR